MPAVQPCPNPSEYTRLIRGDLPESDALRLNQHLADCPTCAATVRALRGDDTLPPAIAAEMTADSAPGDLTQRSDSSSVDFDPAPDASGISPTLRLLHPPQGPGEIGRLAHYRILKILGSGGMGVVFLAEDVRLSRTVALKTMKPHIAADPRQRQRFLREARAAAKVESDYIVPIYDIGEVSGVPWLAMPLLKGQSLDELLKSQKVIMPAQAARLGAQVAKGLAVAHAAGLIHRDVKPANIWVEPEAGGRARLLDFGLARDQSPPPGQGQEPLTQTGAVLGTPAYMAPEQAGSKPLDARADLFSLGCVLYRAVTGRLPFRGDGALGTLVALATETPPVPHEVNPAVPAPLSALIMNLLAKDRTARPPSATAVARALEALQVNPTTPVPMAIPARSAEPPNPWADIDVTEPVLPPQARNTASPATAPASGPAGQGTGRRRLVIAAIVLLVVGLLGWVYGGTIMRIATNKGELVVGVDGDPNDEVEILMNGVVVQERTTKREFTLPAGESGYVQAYKDGIMVGSTRFTLTRGGKESVSLTVSKIPSQPPGPQPTRDDPKDPDRRAAAWVRSIDGGIAIRVNGEADERGLVTNGTAPWGTVYGGPTIYELPKERFVLTSIGFWNNAKVTDAGLANCEGCKNVAIIDLSYGNVTAAGVRHLRDCKNLKDLNLGSTSVGDTGLEYFRDCKDLTSLRLAKTGVSNAGLAHLKGMTKLTHLYLDGLPAVGDDGLKHLAGLKSLTTLDLRGTQATAEGVANLQKALPNCEILSSLDPDRRAATWARSIDGGIRIRVNGEADERFLFTSGTAPFGTSCVGPNVELPKERFLLTAIGLWSNTKVTDAGLANCEGCENVAIIELSGLSNVTDAGVRHFRECKNLRELALFSTSVGDTGLENFKDCKNLNILGLSSTGVSNTGLAHLKGMTKLTHLYLGLLPAVSDDGLKHLAGLKNLTSLDLTGTAVTADGIAALQKALPNCKILPSPAPK